ncbi:MAG: transposase [Acidobacteriota bacterium]
MAKATLTLKLPFLGLNQTKVAEFERLEKLNTEVANGMLLLPKKERSKLSSKDFAAIELGSMVINQTIRNANAETKVKTFKSLPLETNNQGWSVHKVGSTYSLSFSLTRGRSKRIPLQIHQSKHTQILDLVIGEQAQKGSLKLWRSRKGIWYALISCSMEVPDAANTERWLGVDRGQKQLAVASTPEGKTKFFSYPSVRQIRRHFANRRRKLQAAGKTAAVKRLERKERRIIQHINHTISKQIVQFAKANNCGIRLEDLSGIRQNAQQRKQTKADAGENRDYWPYYQLQQMIIYKAGLAGVAVEFVPAAYTSQACCKCHWLGERDGEHFFCPNCGYQGHSDHNASRNIGSWTGMACLIVLKKGCAVMAQSARSNGVYDDPLSSVNTQQTSAFALC